MATKFGYSLVRRREGEFFGERIPERSAQAFMTNDLIGLDLVFFAPAWKRGWTDHPSSKKTVGTGKQIVSKQAHLK
jgi:hypothetical protein